MYLISGFKLTPRKMANRCQALLVRTDRLQARRTVTDVGNTRKGKPQAQGPILPVSHWVEIE